MSEKFKELKSLVIDYKEDKDNEINKLKEALDIFKIMVDENIDIEILNNTNKITKSYLLLSVILKNW